ncbi:MAG: AAA family ATPase [archaeon]|nr:AAA family ATPase [archaeon]MCR4343838.1 AAA family ATPase [Candidatus Scalindua sp.]
MDIKKLIERLDDEIVKTQEGVEQAQSLSRLKEIYTTYNGDDKLVSSKDIYERIKNEPEEFNIKTGWSNFDSIIKGFRLKQLVTVSGITKHGKTSWCVSLTEKFKEHNPLWISLEESPEELVRKFVDRKQEPPLFYSSEVNTLYQTEWIETKIIESIAKYGTKVVFVDQLDFIVSLKSESHHLAIGQAVRDLKQMAKKWNVVIFLICHLRKADLYKNPDLNELKGSGSIAGESDTVILIWRETENINGEVVSTNNTNVSIQANRRFGTTGNVKMVFENGTYLERDFVPAHQRIAEFEDF